MSRLSQNACDNRGTHYRIENKRAMTLIAEMVLIVIVSFTDHVAVLYDDDKSFQVSKKTFQSLLVAGCESFVKEIALHFVAFWMKNHRS